MPQACTTQPTPQNVSQPPGFPPTFSNQLLQQPANMDVETGIFIESRPQMWYPPSTHHQGYVQERQHFSHCPGRDQVQGQVFMMAPPEPRPIRHDVGLHMTHTTPNAMNRLGNPPGHMVAQGTPDPFDFQNQAGGQGGGNYVYLAATKTNNQYGHPQPREASSIELPELPTPPKFRSCVLQYVGLLLLLPLNLRLPSNGSGAEISHLWTTWQYLTLSMGERVPEHLLLELLWTKVKGSQVNQCLNLQLEKVNRRGQDLSHPETENYLERGLRNLQRPSQGESKIKAKWCKEGSLQALGKCGNRRNSVHSHVAPVSLTTANDVVRTSSRVEIEIGCLGGLKLNPMDSSPCVLSAGLLVAAGFGLTWTPEALELTLLNGCKTTLKSRGNVRGIVESNATALATRTVHVSFLVDGEILKTSPVQYRPECFFMEFCCGKDSHLCSTLIAIEEMDGDDANTLNRALDAIEDAQKLPYKDASKTPCSRGEIARLVEDVLNNIPSTMIPLNTTKPNVYDSKEGRVRGLLFGASPCRGPQVAKAGFEHKMLLMILHSLASTAPIHNYFTIQFNHLQHMDCDGHGKENGSTPGRLKGTPNPVRARSTMDALTGMG
eukprot:2443794-Amphidinium_carterae.2